MADSRQCRQRLSAMSVVILQPVLALSSAFPQQFHIFFDVSFLLFFGLLIFLGFLCYCCRFRLEISISAFSSPRMRPMICLSGPSVLYCAFCSASFSLLFHSYIIFVCLAACFVSLFAAAAIAIF